MEAGAPTGSRRVGVMEVQCIHEEALVEEVQVSHVEAWDLGDLHKEKEKSIKERNRK